MMRTLFAAAVALGAITGVAQAMPLAPLGASANGDVIAVTGGCGPGWHRGPYGGCVANRGVVVVQRPPVVVVRPGPRVCPYRMVWAYGRCRPI